MKKISIIILYSEAKREFFATEEQFKTEEEVYGRAKVVGKHLKGIGYKVKLMPGNSRSLKIIEKLKPDIVLNLVDSIDGQEDEIASIPAYLDMARIPYTGAGVSGLTINADKFLTKIILEKSKIPTPDFQIFFTKNDAIDKKLKYPLIVKLNKSHGSLEISQEAIVENEKQLRNRVDYLISKYHQTVIVEKYIRGKEITVLMIKGINKNIILAEERILFKKEKYPVFDYEAAWGEKEIYDAKPFKLSKNLTDQIKKAFNILQLRDYARFEIIVENKNNFYFIDPNANPSFGPYGTTSGPFGYLLFLNNISFDKVAKEIILNAISRFKKTS